MSDLVSQSVALQTVFLRLPSLVPCTRQTQCIAPRRSRRPTDSPFTPSIVQLKPDGTRRRTGGEVKGKLANGVGSQYTHTTSEHGVSSITTADAHTSAASSRLNWRPHRLKWTRPFRRKTKSGFCACAITFQKQSTINAHSTYTAYYLFCMTFKQTAIISTNSINRFNLVNKVQGVFCEVQTESFILFRPVWIFTVHNDVHRGSSNCCGTPGICRATTLAGRQLFSTFFAQTQ